MKKTISLVLALILVWALFGCNKTQEPPIIELSPEELKTLTNPNFSSEPFAESKTRLNFTNYERDEWNEIFSKIPSDRYEIYPYLHNVPQTATLHKNGEITFLDVKDPRLIRLINFYNNSVYYDEYAYLQGFYDKEDIEEIEAKTFKLVLTYTPYHSPESYAASGTHYDTIIVTDDSFYLFAHDIPNDPVGSFTATSNAPFARKYPWLDLFGF